MSRSICLAVYNGETYIKEQLDSVIKQLDESDEIIIIDDCSADKTIDVISSLNESRIKLYHNHTNLGHVRSFEKAIALANNDIIYLCDQDDIWVENRFSLYEDVFAQYRNVNLISSNSYFIDASGKEIEADLPKLYSADSFNFRKNIGEIIRGSIGYYGCAMALKKELKEIILPIPEFVESHDLWVAMAANLKKENFHLETCTFYRRIHGQNDSLKKRPLSKKLRSRYIFFKSYKELLKRIKKNRNESK